MLFSDNPVLMDFSHFKSFPCVAHGRLFETPQLVSLLNVKKLGHC